MKLANELEKIIEGEVDTNEDTLVDFSHDASLFEIKPRIVVFPKSAQDLKALVKFVSEKKKTVPGISVTARAGGTDMSGGPLNGSIIVDFRKYFNGPVEVEPGLPAVALAEAGVFYRDFEKETLKYNLLLPSFPASREICTVGGMVANNAGGEKTLIYGKTNKYVKELKVVLRDGNDYFFRPLNRSELRGKMELSNFEGEIYRRVYKLIDGNYELIQAARPQVSKNSAGYYLWDVWDKETFDLTQLFTGSQGTLGFITEIKFGLIEPKRYSRMIIIFLRDLKPLASIINKILEEKPETFESYDDHTLKIALRFLPQFVKLLKGNIFSIAWKFLPEFQMILSGGWPKLILLAEFTGDDKKDVEERANRAKNKLKEFGISTRIAKNQREAEKYKVVRRESFNLLRHRIKGKQTAPFIDDIIVRPEKLSEFLPKLDEILNKYDLIYTIAGHIGDGNFHIIPLMDLTDPRSYEIIPKLAEEVYALVFKSHGSMTAEHNDGLIRSPYLKAMYGDKIYELFKEVKEIFDPEDIFNPHKKVDASLEYSMEHLKRG